ncbi:MAG: hypothetical protein AAF391_01255 [Bacteroidota bacterium]
MRLYEFDFSDCRSLNSSIEKVLVKVSKSFVLNEVDSGHGFCEYQLFFEDSAVFYMTNDIYSGSMLNAKNLMHIGISGYINRSLNDTIINQGQQSDSLFWKEAILNDVVVGYINASKEDKVLFEHWIKTITRVR